MKNFIELYYVVSDLQAIPLEIKKFGTLNGALSYYMDIPNSCLKALGIEKVPNPLPGSLDIIQCKNGKDTVLDDYKHVPGWNNPQICSAIGTATKLLNL